jgi:futalosine hydrolase
VVAHAAILRARGGYGAPVILVVAATPGELSGASGVATLVCGVGPVEAAARTAAALAGPRPERVLHVGIAGARTFDGPAFVIGSEARYSDADDPRWIELAVPADPALVEAARRVLPGARVEPIGTSARVGGSTGCEVEAMEGYGVLRAAALAGVPAVEVRVLANAIGEPDRARWAIDDALALLAEALPALCEELSRA